MDVENRLTRTAVAVEHGSVSVLVVTVFLRQSCRMLDDLSHQNLVIVLQVIQRGNVTARDEEHMEGRLRIDILKRKDTVVLVNDRRRNFAGGDPAKETVL